MVFLDTSHDTTSMDDIQKDLSPLVEQLRPGKNKDKAQVMFKAAGGIEEQNVVYEAGQIVVDEVLLEKDDLSSLTTPKNCSFRRVMCEQSGDGSKTLSIDRRSIDSYHFVGILSAFPLISSRLGWILKYGGRKVIAVVIGLGTGDIPMNLHNLFPFLRIEVVEGDPAILDVAKKCFNFKEDKRLKVQLTDGIQFIQEAANVKGIEILSVLDRHSKNLYKEGKGGDTVDMIIVNVHSSNSRTGMTCPAADFVEDAFLSSARRFLSDQGLFIVYLATGSGAVRNLVASRMKQVFKYCCYLPVKEDYEVMIASETELKSDFNLKEEEESLRGLVGSEELAMFGPYVKNIVNMRPLSRRPAKLLVSTIKQDCLDEVFDSVLSYWPSGV